MTAGDISALLPHRAPMLLLCELEAFTDATARATVRLTADNPFIDAHGCLDRVAFAEMMAQCFAAGAGALAASRDGRPVSLGYLAALRDLRLLDDAHLGDELVVDTRLERQLGDIVLVRGEVHKGRRLLAEGRLKIYTPGEQS